MTNILLMFSSYNVFKTTSTMLIKIIFNINFCNFVKNYIEKIMIVLFFTFKSINVQSINAILLPLLDFNFKCLAIYKNLIPITSVLYKHDFLTITKNRIKTASHLKTRLVGELLRKLSNQNLAI